MPFARGTRVASLEEKAKDGWRLRYTAGAAGRGIDLENAIRDGSASLPAGMVPRLLVISDGNENLGSVARAIWQAQQMGIPIDTVALGDRSDDELITRVIGLPGDVVEGRDGHVVIDGRSLVELLEALGLAGRGDFELVDRGDSCFLGIRTGPAARR